MSNHVRERLRTDPELHELTQALGRLACRLRDRCVEITRHPMSLEDAAGCVLRGLRDIDGKQIAAVMRQEVVDLATVRALRGVSGPPAEEAPRERRQLHWTPEQAAALATLADRWGTTQSQAAARAFEEALARLPANG